MHLYNNSTILILILIPLPILPYYSRFLRSMQQNGEQLRDYFQTEIEPIFEELITQITLNRPEDIVEYALRFFKNGSGAEGEEEDDPFLHEEVGEAEFTKWRRDRLSRTVRKHRIAVSSEANNMFSSGRKPISLRKTGLKEERTQIMIRFYFSNSFLFRDFDEQEQTFLIDSMVPEHTEPNQKVINEGEFGDCMYFIEEGFFECSLNGEEQEDRNSKRAVQFLKNYQAGDTFGELCLLHRARRQATVTSKTQGMLLSLSRQTYNHVHKMSIGKRRSSYLQKLMNVNIFSTLSGEEFQKLCDLLKEVRVEAGSYIIYEGDMGRKFYIVVEGLLVAKNNTEETFYQYYKEGDYFGELALINRRPRQLSVQAVTKCRLVTLTSEVFLSVINRDKANLEIKNKYRDAKPITNARKKKTREQI